MCVVVSFVFLHYLSSIVKEGMYAYRFWVRNQRRVSGIEESSVQINAMNVLHIYCIWWKFYILFHAAVCILHRNDVKYVFQGSWQLADSYVMSTTMSHIFPIQTLSITVEYREVYNASSRKVIIFGSRCHYLFLSTLCGVRYKKRH